MLFFVATRDAVCCWSVALTVTATPPPTSGSLQNWESAKRALVDKCRADTHGVRSLAYRASTNEICCGFDDGSLSFFDLDTAAHEANG